MHTTPDVFGAAAAAVTFADIADAAMSPFLRFRADVTLATMLAMPR